MRKKVRGEGDCIHKAPATGQEQVLWNCGHSRCHSHKVILRHGHGRGMDLVAHRFCVCRQTLQLLQPRCRSQGRVQRVKKAESAATLCFDLGLFSAVVSEDARPGPAPTKTVKERAGILLQLTAVQLSIACIVSRARAYQAYFSEGEASNRGSV